VYLSQEIAPKSSVPLLMAQHGKLCGVCHKLHGAFVMFCCLHLTINLYVEQPSLWSFGGIILISFFFLLVIIS
jgi:hypothetical protein